MCTFCRRSSRVRASIISAARSDWGNTRFPRSTFRATPRWRNHACTSPGVKREAALYKKRLFRGMLSSSSSTEQSFVTLHRPFPVI